jgi:hypothetical protein
LKSPEQRILRQLQVFFVTVGRRFRYIVRRKGLDHAQTKSGAADASSRQAKGRAIQLVQRAVKSLATLYIGWTLVVAAAGVGIFANSPPFSVLFGCSLSQIPVARFRSWAAECGRLLG